MADISEASADAFAEGAYVGLNDRAPDRGLKAAREEIADLGPDVHSAVGLVCEFADALTDSDGAALYLLEGDEFVCVAGAGRTALIVGLRAPTSKLFAGRCLGLGGPSNCSDALDEPDLDRDVVARLGVRSLLCHPIVVGAVQGGVLEVSSSRPGAFDEDDVDTIRLLAGLTGTAFRNAAGIRAARPPRLSNPIARIPGRSEYRHRLTMEVERSRRTGSPVAVAVVRLEGYYDVAALSTVKRAVGQLRGIDETFAIDAGVFAVIMPGTPLAGAIVAARKVEMSLAELAATGVDVQVGVAQRDDLTPDSLHENAWVMAGGVSRSTQVDRSAIVLDLPLVLAGSAG